MNDCADFWQQYICFNEIAQERLDAEAREWIDKLRTAPPQRVYCSCGDGIVPDDGALCGTCVSLKEKNT